MVALSILGIAVLIADFLYPRWMTILIAVVYLVFVGALWLVLPMQSVRNAMRGE